MRTWDVADIHNVVATTIAPATTTVLVRGIEVNHIFSSA
jgi:hypothetical protein